MLKSLLTGLFMATAATTVMAQEVSKSPTGAKVTVLVPANGATVSNPVAVKFGLAGMDVLPAGTAKENSGHHHLLIDKALANSKAAIPVDDNHKHFGKGQTETVVELTPGEHTLQLILADHNHIPHDPVVQSEVIKITVK
jgi:hypothetical protein